MVDQLQLSSESFKLKGLNEFRTHSSIEDGDFCETFNG